MTNRFEIDLRPRRPRLLSQQLDKLLSRLGEAFGRKVAEDITPPRDAAHARLLAESFRRHTAQRIAPPPVDDDRAD